METNTLWEKSLKGRRFNDKSKKPPHIIKNTDQLLDSDFNINLNRMDLSPITTTETGAKILKGRIKEYWKKLGYEVEVNLNPSNATKEYKKRWDIRSNMIDGLPRNWKGKRDL